MNLKSINKKSVLKTVANVVFFGGMLLLIFNTDAKAWVLRQLVSAGLFKAEIQKPKPATETAAGPSFSYTDSSGRLQTTADLKGKVVFVNFWATWCPPCRAEMPSLHQLYNTLKDDERFVFLFINEDEDLTKARSYLQENQYSFPLVTRTGNLPPEIYSGTLPTTIIFDKNNKVVLRKEGIANYNTPDFIKQLKDLL